MGDKGGGHNREEPRGDETEEESYVQGHGSRREVLERSTMGRRSEEVRCH